jgi:putative (di)nucleoside polyphosphate hydrolase
MTNTKPFRSGVLGVFYKDGKVLVCERALTANAWQFPQGGIDDGEDEDVAIIREVREELGLTTATILKKSAVKISYHFPESMKHKLCESYCGQEHRWYLLAYDGVEPINFHLSDEVEFRAFKWVSPETAVEDVTSWRRDAYRQGLIELGIIF